jgi:phosphatidylglycerophosphatase A
MVRFSTAIATVCGIGYIGKGAGSIAAVAYCFAWFLFPVAGNSKWQLVALCAVLVLGIWSAGKVESIWGHDSNRVVIDEIAGMMITLLWVPVNIGYAIAGLLLFRFFDIVKPLGIKKAERLRGGTGVMADDVLAGIYAWMLLQGIIAVKLI